MIVLDTSVVVAAFATWHEAHDVAVGALADDPRLPAQVAVEAYSVLTRLPHPHRVPGPIAAQYLDRAFPPTTRLPVPRDIHAALPGRCAGLGIEGGSVYDALVAAIAVEHDAVLVSRDVRAAPTYRLIGATVRMIR
ncbi:MAG: PIN domain-containing protein, partial [Actinomycetota bacterium]|nr:PIN domain-containing protein [Actinomycetota bacterium]